MRHCERVYNIETYKIRLEQDALFIIVGLEVSSFKDWSLFEHFFRGVISGNTDMLFTCVDSFLMQEP